MVHMNDVREHTLAEDEAWLVVELLLYDTLPDVYDSGMEVGHKMATPSSISCVEVFL